MVFLCLDDFQCARLLGPGIEDAHYPAESAVADKRSGLIAMAEYLASFELVVPNLLFRLLHCFLLRLRLELAGDWFGFVLGARTTAFLSGFLLLDDMSQGWLDFLGMRSVGFLWRNGTVRFAKQLRQQRRVVHQ
jgi:hypothetical protein